MYSCVQCFHRFLMCLGCNMAVSSSGGQQGSHSAPLGLMSCVRESSPSDMVDSEEIHHGK